MVLVFLWSFVIGREKDVWSSLSLAALIILALKGDALFSNSFQLSFVAVAGILWLAPLIYSRIPKFKLGKESFRGGQILYVMLTYAVGRMVVTPYLWKEKIRRVDYLFLTDPHVQHTDRLRFTINNFHPREVFPDLSTKRMIGGAQIKGGTSEGVTINFQGWSFYFSGETVEIERGGLQMGKRWPKYLITTKERIIHPSSFPVLSIPQTGALTITIDAEGKVKIKGFLKEISL